MAKVINTRPAGQNQDLSRLLFQAGFEPVEIPLVAILPMEEGLARARRLHPSVYSGIFLSSPSGLRQLQEALEPDDFRRWMQKPIFLVGGKSQSLVESLGGRVAFYPQEASVEGFLKEFRPPEGPGGLRLSQRWLHPCSASTRLDPETFKQRGIAVENLPIYAPGVPSEVGANLEKAMAEKDKPTAVLFCSGSAVDNFFSAAPDLAARLGVPHGLLAVSIGPSTSRALSERGVPKFKEAVHADNESLVDALRAAYAGSDTKVLSKKNLEGQS